MPKRLNTHKHDSAEVQGEGSYVVIRDLTVSELLGFLERSAIQQNRADEAAGMTFEENAKTAVGLVVDWNWVDEQEKPLPLPAQDPDVTRRLTTPELRFLRNLQNPFGGSDTPSSGSGSSPTSGRA